jgi:aspartate carbamoyltransferase
MSEHPFLGRSLTVMGDFTVDEMIYLFEKTRELQEAKINKDWKAVDKFRANGPYSKIKNPDLGIYEVFLEDSTRTKHSFINAAKFHLLKHEVFDVATSSINKSETYADSINTILGYSNHIVNVRSKLEGVCLWLKKMGIEFAKRNNIYPLPSFINGGDGTHEHPTQELLDQYTILNFLGWDRSHLHIALIGDQLLGRTLHSKPDGSRIFNGGIIDLIGPRELGMPEIYIHKFEQNGFEVRIYESLDEYLALPKNKIALIWYFTRFQLERMRPDLKDKEHIYRPMVTFQKKHLPLVPDGTVFMHPLPRYKEAPTIPNWVIPLPLNGFETQFINGYDVRTILTAMFAGQIGEDFEGEVRQIDTWSDDFIELVTSSSNGQKDIEEGVFPIPEGTVIDHICKGDELQELKDYMHIIDTVMGFPETCYPARSPSLTDGQRKGMFFLPRLELSESEIKKLAAISPGCTVNIVKKRKVIKKMRAGTPPRIYGFSETSCKYKDCISYPSHMEGVPGEFIRINDKYICAYCEKPHHFKDIWQ